MKGRRKISRFLIKFTFLFVILYGLNIAFIGISTPGRLYLPWLDQNLNYIKLWRNILITSTASILQNAGFIVDRNPMGLTVKSHSGFKLVYSCLGYGITSAFVAFVAAFPCSRSSKYPFLVAGILFIQILNITRLCLISIFYRPNFKILGLNYHDLFNIFLYVFTAIIVHIWTPKTQNQIT